MSIDKRSKWILNKFLEESSDSQLRDDILSEVLSELFNEKYDTDEERVNGVIEAIEFVTNINISK